MPAGVWCWLGMLFGILLTGGVKMIETALCLHDFSLHRTKTFFCTHCQICTDNTQNKIMQLPVNKNEYLFLRSSNVPRNRPQKRCTFTLQLVTLQNCIFTCFCQTCWIDSLGKGRGARGKGGVSCFVSYCDCTCKCECKSKCTYLYLALGETHFFDARFN